MALFIGAGIAAGETVDSNQVIFEGDSSFYLMSPPNNWTLGLEEAQLDGYSASFFPDDQIYADADKIIYVWIFKNNGLTFDKFIEQDTLNYLEQDTLLKIINTETIPINEIAKIQVFEFNDPGGWTSLAKVAYIDAIGEIVIYELHLVKREDYITAEKKFREALDNFSISINK